MGKALTRTAYALAVIAYMFLASGYIHRFADPLNARMPVLDVISFFAEGIAITPLCVMAARSQTRIGLLILYYVGLVYVGMWGGAIIGGIQIAEYHSPDVRVSWVDQVISSPWFLLIWVFINLVPALITWAIARAVVLQRRAS